MEGALVFFIYNKGFLLFSDCLMPKNQRYGYWHVCLLPAMPQANNGDILSTLFQMIHKLFIARKRERKINFINKGPKYVDETRKYNKL